MSFCQSWALRHLHGSHGRSMDFSGDAVLIGSLRCRRKRDEFWSIGPTPNLLQPNPEPPTYVMKFCPVRGHQEILVLANEDGRIAFQDTSLPRARSPPAIDHSFMTGLSAHNNAIFDLSWAPDTVEKIVTVSGDQTAKLWDLSSVKELRCVRTFRGHNRSLKAVEFQPGSQDVFATASRDNTIRVWDSRDKSDNCENVIRNAHKPTNAGPKKVSKHSSPMAANCSSVTAIKFQNEHLLISCGDKDGVVKVWDLRRSYSLYSKDPVAKYQFLHPGDSHCQGFTSLALDSAGPRHAYVSCMDNKIYQLDLVTYSEKPTRQFLGCDNSSFYMRISLSHDDQYLVSGSRDTNAYVWNTKAPVDLGPEEGSIPSQQPTASLNGHRAEVTCIDWCRSQWRLATCTDNMQHRIWEMDRDNVEKEELCGEAQMYQGSSAKPKLCLVRNRLVTTPNSVNASFLSEAKNATKDDKSSTPEMAFCPRQRGVKRSREDVNVAANARIPLAPSIDNAPQSPAKSHLKIEDLPCSPRKMNVAAKIGASPRKLWLLSSPTSNLPNMVRDESSPTQSRVRLTPKRTNGDNWLVTLSRQKKTAKLSKENVTLDGTPPKKARNRAK